MKHIDLVLPFALPPRELAQDLLKAINAPSLATLLARGLAAPIRPLDAYARCLPHEAWLAECLGLAASKGNDNSPAAAAAMMRRHGMDADGTWFILNPVHIHVARDHLVLTDSRNLLLQEPQSRALFGVAQSVFAENGKALLYGDARTWFARADDWADFVTATPDAACGHNIDVWMPSGAKAREWRRLQNEVQMLWHNHAVNNERALKGLLPVNSVWMWGKSSDTSAPALRHDTAALGDWTAAALPPAVISVPPKDGAPALMQAMQSAALAAPERLIRPALAGDWAGWLEALHQLEAEWMEPLLAALRNGSIDSIGLVLTGEASIHTLRATRWGLKRFWLRPGLVRLAV